MQWACLRKRRFGARNASCTFAGQTCTGAEVCNGCDDDANGVADNGFACAQGATRACTSACGTAGTQRCQGDCSGWQVCRAAEACNSCDDDANGVADDGFTCQQNQTYRPEVRRLSISPPAAALDPDEATVDRELSITANNKSISIKSDACRYRLIFGCITPCPSTSPTTRKSNKKSDVIRFHQTGSK